MSAPIGEVRLDGRVDRMDGAWTGARAAGQVRRGATGAESPVRLIIPAGTAVAMDFLGNEVGAIIPYSGTPPHYEGSPPAADCYWYETFTERLEKDRERKDAC